MQEQLPGLRKLKLYDQLLPEAWELNEVRDRCWAATDFSTKNSGSTVASGAFWHSSLTAGAGALEVGACQDPLPLMELAASLSFSLAGLLLFSF